MLNPFLSLLKPYYNRFISSFPRSYNSWAASIRDAAASSSPSKAMQIYTQMHRLSVPFDTFSIVFTFKSIASLQNLRLVRHLHCHVVKLGLASHIYVATSLLNAYAVVSLQDACDLLDEMPERNMVTWNTMVTGYSRNGDVRKAMEVFRAMPERDVASWSAAIAACVCNRKWDKGLAVFREMVFNWEVTPEEMTVGSVLSACSHLGSVGLLVGRSVHGFMVKNMWGMNVIIGTALADMYAKCGLLKYSCRVFNSMGEKNVMTWTALICGFAQNGCGKEALALFEFMQENGVKPNEMTFTGIISSCANLGLVHEGQRYFKMIEEYELEPRIQHYGCMVDLFGKAGLIEEAYEVITKMRFEPNVVIWGSFLSACKEHKKFEMAEKVIEKVLMIITPENGGVYSLISDLYVLNEKWDDAERLRRLMLDCQVRKARGSSFITNE